MRNINNLSELGRRNVPAVSKRRGHSNAMKLYFMPGACSLAVHIALREAQLKFSLAEVDYDTRTFLGGGDFCLINAKQSVPALMLGDGTVLTEVQTILYYLDLVSPETVLIPADELGHLRALEWLSYLSTEIHKSFSPLFRAHTPKQFLDSGRRHLNGRLAYVERHLGENSFLLGSKFYVPDAYLFTLCRWLPDQCFALERLPNIEQFMCRVSKRTSVVAALRSEGLPDRQNQRSPCMSRPYPTPQF